MSNFSSDTQPPDFVNVITSCNIPQGRTQKKNILKAIKGYFSLYISKNTWCYFGPVIHFCCINNKTPPPPPNLAARYPQGLDYIQGKQKNCLCIQGVRPVAGRSPKKCARTASSAQATPCGAVGSLCRNHTTQ